MNPSAPDLIYVAEINESRGPISIQIWPSRVNGEPLACHQSTRVRDENNQRADSHSFHICGKMASKRWYRKPTFRRRWCAPRRGCSSGSRPAIQQKKLFNSSTNLHNKFINQIQLHSTKAKEMIYEATKCRKSTGSTQTGVINSTKKNYLCYRADA